MPFIARSAVAGVALIIAASSGPQAAAKRPVTIDDTFHLKGVSGAQLAPDGSRVLFTVRGWEWPENKVEPDKGAKAPEMQIARLDGCDERLRDGAADHLRRAGRIVPAWSPDGKYISFVTPRGARAGQRRRRRRSEGADLADAADGGEAWKLTDAKEGVARYEWAPDSTRDRVPDARSTTPKEDEEARRRKDDERIFEGDHRMQHLWSIDVESKQATQLTTGTDYTVRGHHLVPRQRAPRIWRARALPDDSRRAAGSPRRDARDESRGADRRDAGARERLRDGRPTARRSRYTMLPFGDATTNRDGICHAPALQLATDALRRRDAGRPKDVSDPSVRSLTVSSVWTPDSKRVLFGVGDRVYRSVCRLRHRRAVSTAAHDRSDDRVRHRPSKDGSKVAFTMDSPAAPTDVFVAGADFSAPRKLTTINRRRRGLRARRHRSHHVEEQRRLGERRRARQAGRLRAGQAVSACSWTFTAARPAPTPTDSRSASTTAGSSGPGAAGRCSTRTRAAAATTVRSSCAATFPTGAAATTATSWRASTKSSSAASPIPRSSRSWAGATAAT